MTTRKQLRAAAVAAVRDVYTGCVFTGRNIDVRDETEYMHVYLSEGDISEEIQVSTQRANLVITYNKDADDDLLDEIIDAAHAAITSNFLAKLALQGDTDGVQVIPVAFEYSPDDSQFSSIAYTYQITYTA